MVDRYDHRVRTGLPSSSFEAGSDRQRLQRIRPAETDQLIQRRVDGAHDDVAVRSGRLDCVVHSVKVI